MNVEALVGWIWIAAMSVFIGAGVNFAVRWLLHRFDGTVRQPWVISSVFRGGLRRCAATCQDVARETGVERSEGGDATRCRSTRSPVLSNRRR